MTSYISSFKCTFRISMIVLAICTILTLEVAFRQAYSGSDSFAIRNQLNLLKPDIILVGNSMIGENIDERIFDEELTNLTNRKIKSLFINRGSTGMPYFYLVVSQQIASSNLSKIPVGIVAHDKESFLTTNIWTNTKGFLKDNLGNPNSIFFAKFADKSIETSYILKNWSYTVYYSPESSLKILNYFVKTILSENKTYSVTSIMFNRFNGINLTQSEILKDSITTSKAINSIINKSFLPDIINASSNFSLFFIASRPRPSWNITENDEFVTTIDRISKYLNKSNITFIKTNDFEDLNNDSLFKDKFHLTKAGKYIESRKLAQEIFARGLIK